MPNRRFTLVPAIAVVAVAALGGLTFALSTGESLDEVEPVTGVLEVVVEDNAVAPRVI